MVRHGDALPQLLNIGASPEINFLVVLFVQKRPATEALNSRVESDQKTAMAAVNWEILGFD
jgi:hypothetical protein